MFAFNPFAFSISAFPWGIALLAVAAPALKPIEFTALNELFFVVIFISVKYNL